MTTRSGAEYPARILVDGSARGEVLALTDALSFWGGLDASTGEIVDPHHPQQGARVTGRVVVMPSGRGSSSSSTVLAEAIRARVAPAGIVLAEVDGIVALGALVAVELYGRACPVAVVDEEAYRICTTAAVIEIKNGTVTTF
jgi:predicted aconitase with swiveling domain